MKKYIVMLLAVGMLALAACGNATSTYSSETASAPDENTSSVTSQSKHTQMTVGVGGQQFTATLEDNDAAAALVAHLTDGPMEIEMRDYSGFEKVGDLPQALPADDVQIDTHPGDLVLYQGDQLVVFYGDHAWSYTRLGHIDDLDGWADALGSGNVTLTLSLDD